MSTKNPVNKPYNEMNRVEKRQHKRWLIKSKSVDLAVLRVEGVTEIPKDIMSERDRLIFMADDYNRILGKKIWTLTDEQLNNLDNG